MPSTVSILTAGVMPQRMMVVLLAPESVAGSTATACVVKAWPPAAGVAGAVWAEAEWLKSAINRARAGRK